MFKKKPSISFVTPSGITVTQLRRTGSLFGCRRSDRPGESCWFRTSERPYADTLENWDEANPIFDKGCFVYVYDVGLFVTREVITFRELMGTA